MQIRSPKQYQSLSLAREERYATKPQTNWGTIDKSTIADFSFQNNRSQYCLAVLTEGLGETQARRFLAKCGIRAPSVYAFYEEQKKLEEKIDIIIEKNLSEIQDTLGPHTVFGVDCSWSARRNAESALTIFMDIKTHKIFDKVIISRNECISDEYFEGPSNMMEYAAIKSKADEFKANYKFVGFVHDFDVHTAPCLQPDNETGQLIEFLDPGHLKKTLENIFKQHNTENYMYKLKNTILTRFSSIVRDKKLTIEQKVNEWYNTPLYIITSAKANKGYLSPLSDALRELSLGDSKEIAHSKSQPISSFSIEDALNFYNANMSQSLSQKIGPDVALSCLQLFLSDTEWLIRKCGCFDTQQNESFNAIKAKMCPKHLHFQRSFKIRCHLAILKWNLGQNWYLEIARELNIIINEEECKHTLIMDEQQRAEMRLKSKDPEEQKRRNMKRKERRESHKSSNSLKAHSYAKTSKDTDNKSKTTLTRYEKARNTTYIPLPSISNFTSNNCFMISILQLIRHTNPEINMQIASNHIFHILMTKLNNGDSISEDEMNYVRRTYFADVFNLDSQEDAAEFYDYVMHQINEIGHHNPLLSDLLQTFEDSYYYTINWEMECLECHMKSSIRETGFTFTIPTTTLSFIQNISQCFDDKIISHCADCKKDTLHQASGIFQKSPKYLLIQLMRFNFENGVINKNDETIQIPNNLLLPQLKQQYDLKGITYHIGDNTKNGHYITKCLCSNGVETFDDERCTLDQSQRILPSAHAYLVLYHNHQTSEQQFNFLSNRDKIIKESLAILEQQKKITKEKSTKTLLKSKKKIKPKYFISPYQLHIQKEKETLVDTDKFREFARRFSYMFSFHTFDWAHGITNLYELKQLLGIVIWNYLQFAAMTHETLFKFTLSFSEQNFFSNSAKFLIFLVLEKAMKLETRSEKLYEKLLYYFQEVIFCEIVSKEEIHKEHISKKKNITLNKSFENIMNILEESC